MNWYLKVLSNYVGFTGRARRKEYWMFILINLILTIIISAIQLMIETQVLSLVYGLLVFLPSLAVCIRRLHDTGRSGWYTLIGFIPLVGLYLIYLLCLDSEPGENWFGPNPKEVEA